MAKKDTESEVDIQDEIIVADPLDLRPKELPLVVTLPDSASKAQVAFAKILNAYAYKNPDKWNAKKDDRTHTDEFGKSSVIKGLITQLKELKNAPDPIEDELGLKYKNNLIG